MTAIIPLIGVLLLFNETIANSLQLAPKFLADIGKSSDENYSLSTLYFTYFGLCSLGFGSIIFSVLCPPDIQSQLNELEYVSSTPIGGAKSLAKSHLRYVVHAFADYHKIALIENDPMVEQEREYGAQGTHEYIESLSYPRSVYAEMTNLLEELYEAADFGENGCDDEHYEQPEFMDPMLGSGYLDFTEFGIAMASGLRIYFAYLFPFYEQAPNFARDIAYMKFRTDDFRNFNARLITAAFYLIGFALLFVPTISTFYLLSKTILTQM